LSLFLTRIWKLSDACHILTTDTSYLCSTLAELFQFVLYEQLLSGTGNAWILIIQTLKPVYYSYLINYVRTTASTGE
jgi:hypothetical protein